MVIDIFCNAADTVSAHGTLRAVQIVHIHLAVCNLRRADQDQTIGTNAKMTVADKFCHCGRILNSLLKTVYIYIIVSNAVQVIDAPITVDGKEYHMTAVSMGNPHAIIYVDDVNSLDLEKIGPSFENHVCFPDRVNTEFVQVIDRHTVKMRVWERGSGETLACGTGACAVTVASILNDKVDGSKPVTVQLLGGDLNISWERDENLVYMTGPATTVFDGEIDLGFLGE